DLCRADRRVGKGAAGSAGAHGYIVAAHYPYQRGPTQVEASRGRGVIDLVVGGDAAHGQSFGCDVGRGRGTAGGQQVVGRIGAADRNAAHAHRFGAAHVPVRKGRCAVGPAQTVARDPIVGGRDGGGGRGVIDLVHARGADRQRPHRDVRRRAGGGVGRVVGRIGACHGDAGHAHGLGRAHVLVGETGRGVAGA